MQTINPAFVQTSISQKMTDAKTGAFTQQATGAANKSQKDLHKTAQDFESIFTFKLLESMRSTVPKSGLLNSFSKDMYQSMFDQELANEMSKGRGIGLADMLEKQLNRMRTAASAVSPASPETAPAAQPSPERK